VEAQVKKNQIARVKKRRSLKRRIDDVRVRIEDRAERFADKALDVVEANLDRWLDATATNLLSRVGLPAPEKISVKEGDEVIDLVRQPDGRYARP